MIDNYNKITVAKYKEIRDIIDKYKEEEDDVNFQIELYACLNDMTIDDVMDMPASDYVNDLKKMDFLLKAPNVKPMLPKELRINGRRYDVVKSADHFTAAQLIDLEQYIQKEPGTEYVLSTIFIPHGHKYMDGYTIDDIMDDMLSVDIITALNANAFFLRAWERCIDTFRTYSTWTAMKQIFKMPRGMRKEKMMELTRAYRSLKSGIGSYS